MGQFIGDTRERTTHDGTFGSRGCWHRALAILAALLSPWQGTLAAVVVANPGNYQKLVQTLLPGDTLQLSTGTYEEGLRIVNLHGEPGKSITITGPESGFPAMFLGSRNAAWNTVQIENSSYINIRHLKLDGLGVDGIDGVNARGLTRHITIERLQILRHGGSQLTVGIATRGPALDWIIRNNMIIGAGTGMYLGSSDGRNPFVRGTIEYNLVRDTLGYNLQIKHQQPWPRDVGLPETPSATVIRHNVFSKAENAATDAEWARPNVLVGHSPLDGPGRDNRYEIYGNFFYQNPGDALFQGEGNLALYDNLFVNDHGTAINIQRHNDRPRVISIFQNTVVAKGPGIRLVHGIAGHEQIVAGNMVFADPPLELGAGVIDAENTNGPRGDAADYLNEPIARIGTLDLYPKNGAKLAGVTDRAAFRQLRDWDRDFNGVLRRAPFRGAYAGAGRNPGWSPALNIMPPKEPDVRVSNGSTRNTAE